MFLTVPGAAVILTQEWDYPEPATSDDETEQQDPEEVLVYVPVWVVTSLARWVNSCL